MPLDLDLVLKIAVPTGTLVIGKYLDRWLTKRPKLTVYLGHASAFTMRGANSGIVHTHTIVIQNAGKVAANNVRVGHNILPEHHQLSPPVLHSVEILDNGGADILIPKLVPGEQVTISYLYFPPLVWNQIHAYTKFDDGYAKVLHVLPTPQYPKWMSRSVWVLVFIGLMSLVYLIIDLIRRII